jgi:hypothetical protein
MTRLLTTALAALLLVGCTSTNSVRFAAKTSTLVGLNEAEASADEAINVKEVAEVVAATLDPDTPIDPVAFRNLVVELVEDRFSGRDEVIYVAVVDELALMIAAELSDADLDLGESQPWIEAAAVGVGQGADLYLLLLESE